MTHSVQHPFVESGLFNGVSAYKPSQLFSTFLASFPQLPPYSSPNISTQSQNQIWKHTREHDILIYPQTIIYHDKAYTFMKSTRLPANDPVGL